MPAAVYYFGMQVQYKLSLFAVNIRVCCVGEDRLKYGTPKLPARCTAKFWPRNPHSFNHPFYRTDSLKMSPCNLTNAINLGYPSSHAALPTVDFNFTFFSTCWKKWYLALRNRGLWFEYIRGGADKSLALPGRRQATATKLWIYFTYSPRSSIHFLARCSNFCKPLKQIRSLSVQPSLRVSNDLRVGGKNGYLHLFIQSRKQVVVRRGQIRRIGWVVKTMEAQIGQFLLGCMCPVSRGVVLQEQGPLGDLAACFI